MKRRLIVAALALGLVAGPLGAPTRATQAVAVVTKDGFEVFRVAFSIQHSMRQVIDQSNAAVAVASCSECEAIAVSIQVILIMSDPNVVTPENLALAMNILCNECTTFASAYQLLLGTDGVVRFTAEGNRKLAEIRLALMSLDESELTLAELSAKIAALVAQLWDVLRTELVAAGQPVESTSPAPSPASTESTGASPSPETSTSPAPSPTPTGTASPEPTPSPTPTGSAA